MTDDQRARAIQDAAETCARVVDAAVVESPRSRAARRGWVTRRRNVVLRVGAALETFRAFWPLERRSVLAPNREDDPGR